VADSGRLKTNPPPDPAGIEVETLLVGLCGTDMEIVAGSYGTADPAQERLIIGHEAVGRVVEAHDNSEFEAAADPAWLRGVITRRVALENWEEAFDGHSDDVNVVLNLG
jgi:NADPH:quinone reductase-like Zn-dependent oxidoreductase